MKNENSTPHLSANGTDYTLYCLLTYSPKERTSGQPSKCKGKVKQGSVPICRANFWSYTSGFYLLLSPQFSLQKISHGTCRTKTSTAKSPLMSRFPMRRESLPPSLRTAGYPFLDGPTSAHWGPVHTGLCILYTQPKSWVFGHDPGITSTKSMDFPQIYFSIMS